MKTINRLLSVVFCGLILAGLVLGICCMANARHPAPITQPTPPELVSGTHIVTFSDNPNVRESAGVSEGNSLGTVKKDCTIEVSCYYMAAEDWRNGVFYGFAVEDLIAAQGDNRWFPKRITKDPDGIVWVNHQYVEIVPTASPAATTPAA